MEVRRKQRKTDPGRARKIARSAITIMLSFMMVFTMMPWLAPEQGTAEAKPTTKTVDEAIAWLDSKVGESIDYDGVEGVQCVDLAKAYYNYLGVEPVGGNGKAYETNKLPDGWTRIPKGEGTPQKGDIIYYGQKGSNVWGHVAIYRSNNVTYHQRYAGSTCVVKVDDIAYDKCGNYRGCIRPQWKDADVKPLGYVESITSTPGQIALKGWVFDPDNTRTTVTVRVCIDGKESKGGTHIGSGFAYNNDNGAAKKKYPKYNLSNYHGFSFTIQTDPNPTTNKSYSGKHKIFVQAISYDKNGNAVKDPENNVCIGYKEVDIKKKVTYTVNTGDATNIKNTSAAISGYLTPAGDAARWGFYCGTSEADMNQHKYTVAASPTSSSNMTAQVEDYVNLEPGTKYYYKVWANVNGTDKTGNTATFTTSAVKPDIPTLKVSSASRDIGIGDSPKLTWNAVNQADYYNLFLYDEEGNEVEVRENLKGTADSFSAIAKDGTYTARIESWNSVGTKGKSEAVSFEVHPDVLVTFVDADSFVDVDESYVPEELETYQVHWGHDSDLPSNPSHKGYTFSGWSGTYKGVTENTTVKAVYDLNQYTASFVDAETGETLKTQKVDYFSAATPPDYSAQSGYAKLGYDGWDKDYSCITEDTTFYTCVGWYDDELPIYATITNAVREYDTSSGGDEGYTVTLNLKNWDAGTTKGRVVVALKTSEGKLLTSTESAAFSIKSSATKEMEVFVPYANAASLAEAYVIGQYKDAVPIATAESSNNASYVIDQSNTMTSWSTEEPPAGASNVETRTEYRYQDKQTTTSYSTSLAGYTQDGGSWVQSGSGSITYVSSFPSGFNKSSWYYLNYNNKPKTASETATEKTTVQTTTKGYIFWHWCRGESLGATNRLVNECKSGDYTHWHSFMSESPVTFDTSKTAFYSKRPDTCGDSYWWIAVKPDSSQTLPVKVCSYTDYKKLFNYYRWTDWSDWSTTAATASSTRNVETRTVYRYQLDGTMDEDTSGEQRTVSGTVDSSFAGKEATLFIYKVSEASDFTNEYVDQTVIGEDGGYAFDFKLREEPTVDTGDFTVALGIQGTTTPIYLDTIEAPKKEYTVNFYDYDGTLLSTETVEEHANATLPDESNLVREGYTFSKWSDTNMNVTEDRNLYAEYKINTYTVVFVDWQARTVSMEKFEYGAPLVAPVPEEPDERLTVEWDKIADGVQTVTEDLIVTTRYKAKSFKVKVLNSDTNEYETQDVEYGKSVILPDVESTDEKEFVGWKDISSDETEGLTDTIITKNAILCPVYVFNETVADPVADLEQGVYDSAQTVKLSCDTAGADIYYTLDGSNPTELTSTLYTGPFEIDGAVELKFYACKAEMNDSNIQSRLYSVNYDGATSKWMLQSELPDEVLEDMTAYSVQKRTGYRYKDTTTATTLSEAAALESTGWTIADSEETTYSDYSAWAEELSPDIGDYINAEVETQPVYTSADQFKYSHYVYEDGVTQYAPKAVEGFDCQYEETALFDNPLNIAGFDSDGNDYYSYDGQIWYNQEEISGQIQTGTKYRWRYQIIEYTKWSDWTITKPGTAEQREYETSDVYCYVRPNNYLVNVHFGEETWSYLVKEGSLASLEELGEILVFYEEPTVYSDEQCTKVWNIEEDTVTGNLDLYVTAEKETYTVTFMDLDENEISSQTAKYGESVDAPEPPAREGYKFIRWSSDEYKSVVSDVYIYPEYVAEDEYATVTLDNESLTLYKGKTVELTAVVSPLSKADTELTWTSSDESVACVSETGKVTALDGGEADITVTVNETGETAVCKITVKVDNSNNLVLIKNDKLSVDSNGYLRGARGNQDTVADIVKYFDNANLAVVNAAGEAVSEDALFGTGYAVQLVVNGIVKDAITAVVTGDVTGEGSISNKDISMLLRSLLGKTELTEAQAAATDANGDGYGNARDAVLISRVIVGKATLE